MPDEDKYQSEFALPQPEPAPYCQMCGNALDGYVPPEPAPSWELVEKLGAALQGLHDQVRCIKHTKLRHPMCGDCQVIGRTENALAEIARARESK